MKKQILNIGVILFIILFFYSCSEKKIQYFKLNFEFSGPLNDLKENDLLPNNLSTLLNYIDTNCSNNLYVPIITFSRIDFNPPKTINYEISLSGVNKFRKSLDLLSSINLKEDYDDKINKLKTPKILVGPYGTNLNESLISEYKVNTYTINLNDGNNDSLAELQEKIKRTLCIKKGNCSITILVLNTMSTDQFSHEDFNNNLAKADNLFSRSQYKEAQEIYFKLYKIEPQNTHIKSQLNKIEKFSETTVNSEETITTISTSTTKSKISSGAHNGSSEIISDPGPNKTLQTLQMSYGYYKGETKNGLRDGQGTMFFNERYLISPKDLKKRYAEAGDYVSGTWVEGNIVNGKLFDKNGEQKETLYIGH